MTALRRWLDLRAGEARPVASFFVGLLALVVAHTVVETARDGLFLAQVGASELGGTYVVLAGLALLGASASARLTTRLGPRRALLTSQVVAAAAVAPYAVLPPSREVLFSLYGVSAVIGAALVPQLWASAGSVFHASQSRRLFAVIALAGVTGAMIGSTVAAAALVVAPLRWLFVLASVFFLVSAMATSLAPPTRPAPRSERRPPGRAPSPFAEEPILIRIAAATALGAVAALLVDYAFKTALAAAVPAASLGQALAAVTLATSALALVAQLALSRLVVARAGVVGANGFASSLVFTTCAATVLSGGALAAIVVARVLEGATRHSVHRTATELLYLAVPPGPRHRAKPVIDGFVARGSQAVVGVGLAVVAGVTTISVSALALVAAATAAAWGAATFRLWKPYLALFRRSLGGGALDARETEQQLDLASVDVLVEALGSPDPRQVAGALGALARRGRSGLVPALVLLHEDEEVLETALGILAATRRRDWIRFAEKLADDRRWKVRRAALRALTLARSPGDAPRRDAVEEHPWTRGYLLASQPGAGPGDAIGALGPEVDARDVVLGVLAAVADRATPDDPAPILAAIAGRHTTSRDEEVIEAIAQAASAVAAVDLLPWMVARLAQREARTAIRRSLVAMGEPALRRVVDALLDPSTPRRVRVHLPRTLGGFGAGPATDALFRVLSTDADGLVRYKCLQTLEPLVHGREVAFSAAQVRPLAHRALAEHFRALGLRAAIQLRAAATARAPATTAEAGAAQPLLARLLAEKAEQALLRAFLLLGLAFPHEDLRRVHHAATGRDPAARSSAAELLDALLVPRRGPRRHDELREWLRLAIDDLPDADRAVRAGRPAPADPLGALADDGDATIRALARVMVATDPPAAGEGAIHG